MTPFEASQAEDFLLFVKDSRKTLEDTRTISPSGHINSLPTLLCGDNLHEFNILTTETGATTNTYNEEIIEYLVKYFFPANTLSKQT